MDDASQCNQSVRLSCLEEPNSNSTMIEPRLCSQTEPCLRGSYSIVSPRINSVKTVQPRCPTTRSECSSGDCSLNSSVGHASHIPRVPPSPATYTVPSVMDRSTKSVFVGGQGQGDLFGMIKLRDNDVCYTSGIIEWVGRKRSFPLNSGFKLINEELDTHLKKVRKLNATFNCDSQRDKDCDCADVLPTVNAIVDHLNALHEAVDLVDLRLNTLEDVLGKERCGK